MMLIAAILTFAAIDLPTDTKSHIMIDLKQRATDYREAFELLKKEKGAAKVYFELAEGTKISNIIDMTLMSSGHLILFKFNTQQGIKQQVVPVEQIAQLSYFP
ncbi:MAG: hypothetical protein JSR58_01160 [Verrucomicrobia bacterium]|nr:hypothetical protein [Verrucomicrobiota bacterium]